MTAVELLPTHTYVNDEFLVERGLRNYWGYQSIGYLAPHNAYSSVGDGGGQVDEFRRMVRDLHAAGLEVILDVVFNHTAEGSEYGPTLCFRGIDNAAYYRLADDPSHYVDDTGCGNTIDMHTPAALRLVMDSLRYWTEEMHVDGFRFDLAAALGRGTDNFDPLLLVPRCGGTGPGALGCQADRRTMGHWWLRPRSVPSRLERMERQIPRHRPRFLALGERDSAGHGHAHQWLAGSVWPRWPTPDGLGEHCHRPRWLHLDDLVSYDAKHNEANGENNRDGNDDNRSWNCGVEGPTDNQDVLELRARQRRNFLATLMLSEGVPLLLGGDEFARTQHGNNNSYCQDNELSWLDWGVAAQQSELIDFTARLCRVREDHPVFRRQHFFRGVQLTTPSETTSTGTARTACR